MSLLLLPVGPNACENHQDDPAVRLTKYEATCRKGEWRFRRPDGTRESGKLHLLVGQPFELKIINEDAPFVLQVPSENIKVKAEKGKAAVVSGRAAIAGQYAFEIESLDGKVRIRNSAKLVIVDVEEYSKWLAGLSDDGLVEGSLAWDGREIFKRQCINCHSSSKDAKGPNLEGLYRSNIELEDGTNEIGNERYLRESILKPDAKTRKGWKPAMPAFKMNEEELMRLIAYLRALKPGHLRKQAD